MAQKVNTTVTLLGDYSDVPDGIIIPAKLVMRPPKAKDQINAQRLADDDAGVEVMVLANLCETLPSVIEELETFDYAAVQKAYTDFASGKHLRAAGKSGKPA